MITTRDVTYHGQPANITGRRPDGKIELMVFRPRNERDAKHGPCYRVVCDESEIDNGD